MPTSETGQTNKKSASFLKGPETGESRAGDLADAREKIAVFLLIAEGELGLQYAKSRTRVRTRKPSYLDFNFVGGALD